MSRDTAPRCKTGHAEMSNDLHSLDHFNRQFWRNSNSWPHDPPGYVFLARAFVEIGHAEYGTRWIESSHELEDPGDPPDDADHAAWQRNELAYGQYERACDQAKADFQSMRTSVMRKISEKCGVGNLITAVRAKSGGAMVGLEPYFWNTENFSPRFPRCDISLANPFSSSRFHRSHWIYVTQDSLDRYLGKVPAIDQGAQRDRREDSSHAESGMQPGKRPASKVAIRQAAREVYQEAKRSGIKPPNVNQAQPLIRQKLPGHDVPKQMILSILSDQQFANQRWKRGNQPKK